MGYIGKSPTPQPLTATDIPDLSASKITSGTLADARFPSTLPAVSGANLTGIASDFVKITTTNITSSTSSVDYTNSVISTTYKTFKVLLSNAKLSDDNANLKLRISTDNGSSFLSSSIYARNIWATSDDSGNDSFSGRASTTTGMDMGHIASGGNASGESQNAELTFLNPHSTANQKYVTVVGGFLDHNGNGRSLFGTFRINTTSAISGLQVLPGSGTISTLNISIYGIKA
jgi:hypothetical protein